MGCPTIGRPIFSLLYDKASHTFRTICAVEMDMLTRMVASVLQIFKNDYEKLRVKAIRDVKQTNGSIDILEAINESEDNI